MKKNSSNSMQNDFQISDELRELILNYINACNDGDNVSAEALLHKINSLKADDCKH